jgi:dihydroorotate dehydrogenase (NAD+) catalytic subunit
VIELAPHHKRGLSLANPVMNASGTLGFADRAAYRGLIDFTRLGAFVTNALTFTPRPPAHPPNVVPLPNGLLIHTGLPNPGVTRALQRHAADWARLGPPVIVHLAATSPADVIRSVERLERADGVSGIELGFTDDVSAEDLARLIRAALGGVPLLARLPLARALDLAEPAVRAGADALTVGAPPRVSIEIEDRTVTGRLYSYNNFSLALEAVRAIAGKNLQLPLIGAGGIASIENAQALLAAGASAVQVDAAVWTEPAVLNRLADCFAG